mgnify:FL=1
MEKRHVKRESEKRTCYFPKDQKVKDKKEVLGGEGFH